MNVSLSPYIAKAKAYLHADRIEVESPAIAEPTRDWKYLLIGSAVLTAALCAWALYAGLTVPQAQEEPRGRAARLDRDRLARVLAAFEAREAAHEAARRGSRAFVDPGR